MKWLNFLHTCEKLHHVNMYLEFFRAFLASVDYIQLHTKKEQNCKRASNPAGQYTAYPPWGSF